MNRDNDKGKILVSRSVMWIFIQLFLFITIISRLYYLQVYQADKFRTLADENRISTRLLVPPRGTIEDRNGLILAGNQQNFQAMVISEQTANISNTLSEFSKIVPLNDNEIERIKKDLNKYRRFVPIKIKDNLGWEEVSQLLLASNDLSGVIIEDGFSRYYPLGKQTAHLIGYVSAVSENDIKQDGDPLLGVPGFKIGKDGVEKTLENTLRGQAGNLKLEVNALGRVMKEIEKTEGRRGEKISLSIDARLQKKAFDIFGEESGAAILMDVNTGEILSFVSAPSFDSNDFVNGISHNLYNELLGNEKSPLLNKAIAGQYSPGSTFKMIVALAGLESGIITKDTRFSCYGKLQFGNHLFHCWKKQGHGALNLVEALQHSCDIYFYELAQRVGIDKIAAMARRFGLDAPTNIGLQNEKRGLIPDKAWKKKNRQQNWTGGETLIAGIGQGYILTTPLQLAVMTAMIANDGKAIKPTLIKQDSSFSMAGKSLGLNPAHIALVKEGMFSVINRSGGTALAAQFEHNGKRMSGKTGTTQVKRISLQERQKGMIKQDDLPWKHRNHALFVGYAPHDTPKYAVAVLVEHGKSGSAVAAPIASKLLLEAIKLDEEKK